MTDRAGAGNRGLSSHTGDSTRLLSSGDHAITLETSFQDASFVLRSIQGTEALSTPFIYTLELLSAREDINPQDVLGTTMTVTLETASEPRQFHGRVASFRAVSTEEQMTLCRVELRPFLWSLGHRVNYRVFRRLTVPAIVKAVCQEHRTSDIRFSLVGDHPVRDYVVQHGESDLAFISRLLEDEGIHYFFEHHRDRHELVLHDGLGGHEAVTGYESIDYQPFDPHRRALEEQIWSWQLQQSAGPEAVSLVAFDHERPKADLAVTCSAGERSSHGVMEFPGGYLDKEQGRNVARVRLEELAVASRNTTGVTNARGLRVGRRFRLNRFPRQDQNREYLVTSASFSLRAPDIASTSRPSNDPTYECTFSVLDTETTFRPRRRIRKPQAVGPQTAMVVAAADGDESEIWSDKSGRVLVRFHWMHDADPTLERSCWARVSQASAGRGWGAMHVPRIGQEVVIEFLNGDPDQPIIVGAVYNGDNVPPYDVPTQSGVRTHSTPKGGSNDFNEIRFEDRKGSEELYVHAQKTQTTVVRGDQTVSVGGGRSLSVGGDDSNTIGGKRTSTIQKDDNLEVAGSETIAVARAMSVSAASLSLCAGSLTASYGGNASTTIGSDETVSVTGRQTITVTQDRTVEVTGRSTTKVGSTEAHQVGGRFAVDAGRDIVLSSGGASITLKKSGEIILAGTTIIVDGSSSIALDSSGTVSVKGSKIKHN